MRRERTTGSLRSRRMPSLPVPEGLERDGVALRRLRARDAGPFAAAFREDPRARRADRRRRGPDGERGASLHRAPAGPARARRVPRPGGHRRSAKRPFLGHVMLHTLAWRHRRAEIGYWLVPAARGRGVGDSGRVAAGRLGVRGRSSWSASRSPRRPTTRPRRALARGARLQRGGRHDGPQSGARKAGRRRAAGPFAQVTRDGSRLSRYGRVA